ncbi:baseplate J/gp47 family protein [Dyadobacter psychrotolerans]|uniref:Baseplate protein J-like domain-containing protein n=1 Tax=Dyadobacter psychrotolerans TaxID=2541721 RepID=A0A4R5DYC1_9BACT|nr:hypothetical protein [Dyadobacter psychrotolerans]TDE17724.1 hypothetical protein E0F88_07485 [Dyadobacter psychrotolerans]
MDEVLSDLETGFRDIYGEDINLDQNSPDGQMMNIFAQAATDLREALLGIYNSFNPNNAIGTVLDQRVPINNIARKGGTFTIQPIDITVDRTVDLSGLDADFTEINGTGFTVQDDAGNKFILVDSTTLTVGTTSLNFRAQQIGLVETTVGTITTQSTIVLGVTAVNNSSGALQVGQNEETDLELRIRREQSVALSASGYLNGLYGTILNIDGVTDAKVYENYSDVTDSNGIPAHGIWVIAEGGANADIAEAIYNKKSYGANMKGTVAIPVTTASGDTFTARFDRPVAENLYIRFDVQRTVAGTSVDSAGIKQYIVDNLEYNIGQYAETSRITAVALSAILATGGSAVPVNVEISKNGSSWFDYLTPTTLSSQFVLDVTRIAVTVL